jgi:pyruvate dehydrogenase E2 component (dihydrolipoamide acetyltransferase)
VRTIRANIL